MVPVKLSNDEEQAVIEVVIDEDWVILVKKTGAVIDCGDAHHDIR
jgi:hypothetical protein